MPDLSIKDFAEIFGATEDSIAAICGTDIEQFNFRFRIPTQSERDAIILNALEKINSASLPMSGEHRKGDWEDGWRENLDAFIASDFDLNALIPKYHQQHRPGLPVRLNRDFVYPESADFGYHIAYVFRSWILQTYLPQFDNIHEFGCGTGHNLAYLASLYPDKHYYGYDWATSSQEIIRLLAVKFGWQITGHNFDFFNPDEQIELQPNSAVFTFGALEQVGKNHNNFLQFLLQRKPALCVNIEGLHELYDPQNLSDYLALKYHLRRNYLNSYLTSLRELEAQGKIAIEKVHYQPSGFYDDPHSYVIWRPL